MSDLAGRFMERFSGLKRAHGVYVLTGKKDDRGKVEGKARTVKRPITEDLWRRHLEGKSSLGIVPIDDEGSTNFGAIDIDVYDLDLLQLEREVREKGLPLILCKTKSGGAHLYLFLKERAPAREVRRRLKRYAEALGYLKTEIFPKQSELGGEDDIGSWINMPYFGDSREAVYLNRELTAEDFLDAADEMAVGSDPEIEGFEGAPPCLKAVVKEEVEEGIRDKTAYMICVYCKERHGDGWQDEARFLIKKHIPSLDARQAQKTVDSVRKKSYRYACKEEPFSSLCDKALCAEAEHGMRESRADLGVKLSDLRKIRTDPPTWLVKVDGKDLELKDTDDLTLQPRFRRRCFEEFNRWPKAIRSKDWDEIIDALGRGCADIEAPDDAGRTGEVMGHTNEYLSVFRDGKIKDGLLIGRAFEEDGWIYFNSTSLLKFLKGNKVSIGNKELWNILRKFGAEPAPKQRIKGRQMRLWKVPSDGFRERAEPLDVPDIGERDRFR